MWHTWERGETCTGFWWESAKGRDRLEDQGVNERIGSKWILKKLPGRMWSGFTWIRIGNGGGLL
jgi:hypothetical protein